MDKHRKRKICSGCLLILLALLIIWIIWSNLFFETTYYTISSDNLPDSFSGFRIVQISDLHNAEFGSRNTRLCDAILELKPDIIVLTGDLVDRRQTNYEIAINFARQAVQIAPTYYITGNHEARIAEYPELESKLAKSGVIILNDRAVQLDKSGQSVQLIGLHDPMLRRSISSQTGKEILTDLKLDMYSILLAHDPADLTVYAGCGVDLVLSGHIHGGQFRIPFLGGLYAPGQGILPQYDAGLYTENNTQMIISRGLGNSVFPFRINNRPEIVVIDLKNE